MSISETRKTCREMFKNFRATLAANTDEFAIINWQAEDEPHRINYIVDKSSGEFIISGSTGKSIAEYSRPLTLSKLRALAGNENDYANKIRMASSRFEYDVNGIIKTLRSLFDSHGVNVKERLDQEGFDSIDELWDCVSTDLERTITDNTPDGAPLSNDAIRDFACKGPLSYYDIPYEDISNAIRNGQRASDKVIYWLTGFDMACEQLGIPASET